MFGVDPVNADACADLGVADGVKQLLRTAEVKEVFARSLLAVAANVDEVLVLGGQDAGDAAFLDLLAGAVLAGAVLSGAVLAGAVLSGAFLAGAFLLVALRRGEHFHFQGTQPLFEEPLHFDAAADLQLAENFEHRLVGAAALGGGAAFPLGHETSRLLFAVAADLDEIVPLADQQPDGRP